MKKRIALCLLLASLLILAGCTMFRQPDPGNQPDSPEQQQPLVPEPPPDPNTSPRANEDSMLEQPLASDISDRVMEITGVENAVAIVLGNMAIIGVEIQDGVNPEKTEEQVSDQTKANFQEIKTAYVTSEMDLVDSIASLSERISRGQPTSELMDDLFDIWQRIQD